jgi:LacI family transcriptional regulator
VIRALCATTTSPTAARTGTLGAAGVADRTMAVFADGNHQRLGINQAAASLGLRLPDDVSVVGFGDLPFVDWVTPRLTTVRTPLADMTVRAACTLPLLLSGQQRGARVGSA